MRTKLIAFLLACGLSLSLVSGVRADAASEARKGVQAAVDRETAAVNRKDTNGVLAAYTPDYKGQTPKGTVTLAQMRQGMGQLFKAMQNVKASQKITAFALKGKTVTTTIASRLSGEIMDPQKKAHIIVSEDSTENVWVKTPKGWLKQSSKSLKETATIDGKPAPGM